MNVLSGIILAFIGGLLGAAGFYFYQSATQIINRGERLWGLGWFFEGLTQDQANLYQIGGIAGMVIGGIVILGGIIMMLRKG